MLKISSIMFCLLLLSVPGCSLKNYFVPNDENSLHQPSTDRPNSASKDSAHSGLEDSVQVVANPNSIPVLVNKQNKLPDGYKPKDLVDPEIPFIFGNETTTKRMMRSVAASAIEKLFAVAKQQGIYLLGVSAYRSYSAQNALFNYYVNHDGYEAAKAYSALPGTSEHETGLAIDVTGGNGQCAAEDCFAGSKEAKWLQKYAADYGFIIRYPKGKESITGYQYEPWHLRYVGKTIAKKIMKSGITLEEYYHAIPVNK